MAETPGYKHLAPPEQTLTLTKGLSGQSAASKILNDSVEIPRSCG